MKIFAFINGPTFCGHEVVAVAEDGRCLAGHISSSISWAKSDIGIASKSKHDLYRAACPEGYELEWVDDVSTHPQLSALIERLNAAGVKS